jgi:ParB family chromosome partitioning protein
MAEEAGRARLGRGLAALIGNAGDEAPAAPERPRGQRKVPVEFLRANPRNPRRLFAPDQLEELVLSVRERGVIQPILVRALPGTVERYEIIAGERRWRAAQQAGLHAVPIVVTEASDRQSLELAIIENVQRTDLNPLEEALGFQALADEFGHKPDDIAKVVGKSRSHVANMLRLLNLPEGVKAYLADGRISAGHARALLALPDPEAGARAIVERGLNVRQVEALAQEQQTRTKSATSPAAQKDADTRALERRLSDALGLTVTVSHGGEGGELKVRYRTLEQLDEVARRLTAKY